MKPSELQRLDYNVIFVDKNTFGDIFSLKNLQALIVLGNYHISRHELIISDTGDVMVSTSKPPAARRPPPAMVLTR